MRIRNFTFAALVLGTIAVAPVFATTITGVKFTPAVGSPFTSSLMATSSGTQAFLTGPISCDSGSTCTGEVGIYNINWDVTAVTPVVHAISGTLSGNTAGSGSLIIAGIVYPFALPPGGFNETIATTEITLLGMIGTNYTLDLSIPAGQTVTLPLTVTAAPEPTGQSMISLGLLGMIGLVRYRLTRS
jgi:hypothetical protein